MKFCVIQPYYSLDEADEEKCFADMLALLESCGSDLDVIVLPEYSNVLADVRGKEGFDRTIQAHNEVILQAAAQAARRCHAVVFVNAAYRTADGWRNTTFALDRSGSVAGKYFKAHPAPSEVQTGQQGGMGFDVGYSYGYAKPYIIELEGVRYGFMTCYDFYFYEAFAGLARSKPDVIIGCSHQRTDTHTALSIINRFLAYNTNAYLVRSAVSLGETAEICGCSCAVAPNGEVIFDMKSRIGKTVCEIDPHKKYTKPAGFGGAPKAHFEYIEEGRRPWLYRNSGSFIVPFDAVMRYPRTCYLIDEENCMKSVAAHIAQDAEEIGLMLFAAQDEAAVCSYHIADRLYAAPFESLKTAFGERVVRLADVLRKFAGHTVINLIANFGLDNDLLERSAALVRQYDCERHVYFTLCDTESVVRVKTLLPDTAVCLQGDVSIEDAAKAGADKLLLNCHDRLVQAREAGLICLGQCGSADEATTLLGLGFDTVLLHE